MIFLSFSFSSLCFLLYLYLYLCLRFWFAQAVGYALTIFFIR